MAESRSVLVEPLAAAPGIAGAAVALLVVDDDCRIAEASLAACRLLGMSREEIADRPLTELLATGAAERLQGVWGTYHQTGGHAGPFELGGNDGGAVDISVTAAVVPGRHLVLLSPSEGQAARGPRRQERIAPRGPTSRERQILTMLAAGDTDIQVAETLELSPATVQTHVRNAKAKLGARTRAQAVAMALRSGIIDHD